MQILLFLTLDLLVQLLTLWKDQFIYPADISAQIEAEMTGKIAPGSAYPAPPPHVLRVHREQQNQLMAQSEAPPSVAPAGGAPWEQPQAQGPPPSQSRGGPSSSYQGQYNAVVRLSTHFSSDSLFSVLLLSVALFYYVLTSKS